MQRDIFLRENEDLRFVGTKNGVVELALLFVASISIRIAMPKELFGATFSSHG